MCGIFGLIYHGTGRTREQVNASADLFTTLAVQSAERGVDATGLARVDSDGYMALYKNCLPSYEVVNFKRWWRPLLNISPSTVAVLGHTRYGTHGDNTQDNANHVHAVWREFNGDFGVDLLAEHYRNSAHHKD